MNILVHILLDAFCSFKITEHMALAICNAVFCLLFKNFRNVKSERKESTLFTEHYENYVQYEKLFPTQFVRVYKHYQSLNSSLCCKDIYEKFFLEMTARKQHN